MERKVYIIGTNYKAYIMVPIILHGDWGVIKYCTLNGVNNNNNKAYNNI